MESPNSIESVRILVAITPRQLDKSWMIFINNLLFGVPAISATSERIFSSSGRILEKRRQSLKPDIVDDILMIRNFRDI